MKPTVTGSSAISTAATGRWRVHAGLGGFAALGLVLLLSETHFPLHSGAQGIAVGAAFLTLALESAPALLIAFAMAGLAQVFMPTATLAWMTTGRSASESVRGMVFGLPLPICSCGVIPLYQSLVQQQVPATAAIAFLVATPELGIHANNVAYFHNAAYQNITMPAEPITAADEHTLRALLHRDPVSGERAERIQWVIETFAKSLACVAAHEIGHSLGLEHTSPVVISPTKTPIKYKDVIVGK